MKKLFFLLLISYLTNLFVSAQQDQQQYKGQFYIAPDFGLMLGSVNRIEISPACGYHLTDRFSLAAGFKYEFYSETRLYNNMSAIKTHIIGPRLFARYTVLNNLDDFLPIGLNASLFAHTEFEGSSLERKYFINTSFHESGRFWYNTILIGGGFSQVASDRVNLNILVLWDTYTGSIALYTNPIIRFGFQFYIRPKTEELEY